MLSTSELSLLQAWKEMKVYADRTERMFQQVRELYYEENETEFTKKFSRIQKYENISDRMEVEIAQYLTKLADGRLSDESKHQLQVMLRVVSEIESVGDGCYNLARTILRKRENKANYTKEMNANVELMLNLVEGALHQMIDAMQNNDVSTVELNRSENIENEINNFRNQLKMQNILDVKAKLYDYQDSITYMDIIVECEKTGDYIINIVQALNEASEKYKL